MKTDLAFLKARIAHMARRVDDMAGRDATALPVELATLAQEFDHTALVLRSRADRAAQTADPTFG